MAAGAYCVRTNQHTRGRSTNKMVRKANDPASFSAEGRKNGVMRAFLITLGVKHMEIDANCRDRFYVRRLGAMIPMARGAGGRGEISSFDESRPVDACPVFVQLISGD